MALTIPAIFVINTNRFTDPKKYISKWLFALDYGQYVFTCIFEDDAVLPFYKGSTLRGVFGHALKKVVCALKKQECSECLLASRCLYPAVFEAIPSAGFSSAVRQRIAAVPHPYVIEPPDDSKTAYRQGERLDFVLLLFGEANEYLPYFIYAFDQMGRMGIGKRRDGQHASFFLERVCVNDGIAYSRHDGKICKQPSLSSITVLPQPVIREKEAFDIRLTLVTPLRLKYQNNLHAELPFHVLTRAMLRRVSSLLARYDGQEPDLDYRGMVKRAEEIRIIDSKIRWYDWRRYSNRQEQAMLMGGMTGEITYCGQLDEYLPLLRFCEVAHLGKQTTFGLGKIRVQVHGSEECSPGLQAREK
jgi:hypothetical protein